MRPGIGILWSAIHPSRPWIWRKTKRKYMGWVGIIIVGKITDIENPFFEATSNCGYYLLSSRFDHCKELVSTLTVWQIDCAMRGEEFELLYPAYYAIQFKFSKSSCVVVIVVCAAAIQRSRGSVFLPLLSFTGRRKQANRSSERGSIENRIDR